MNNKVTYFTGLFLFLPLTLLLGMQIELVVLPLERDRNETTDLDKRDRPVPGRINDLEAFYQEVTQKKITVEIKFSFEGQKRLVSAKVEPSKGQVRKFLQESYGPSKINFLAFLNQYDKELERSAQLVKKNMQNHQLFTPEEASLLLLYRNSQIASSIQIIFNIPILPQKKTLSKQHLEENLTERLAEVTQYKEAIWNEILSFYLTNYDVFWPLFYKNSITSVGYLFSIIYLVISNFQKEPPEVSYLAIGMLIFLGTVTSFAFLTKLAIVQHEKINRYIEICNIVDAIILLFLSPFISHLAAKIPCNPIGLFMPFLHFFANKKLLSTGFAHYYKNIFFLLKYERYTLSEIRKKVEKNQQSIKSLENASLQYLPTEIIDIIASFVWPTLAYKGFLNKIKRVYYTTVAVLSPTMSLAQHGNEDLKCSKKTYLVVLRITRLLAIIYFGFSLYSVFKAVIAHRGLLAK